MIPDLPDPGISVPAGALRWRILPEEKDLLEVLGGLDPRALGAVPGLERVRAEKEVFWGRLHFHGREYFLKRRRLRKVRRRLIGAFRPSRMKEEWLKTWWLRGRGMETVEPVAVGEVRRCGLLVENLLVSRWIPAAHDLGSYLTEKSRSLAPAAFEALRRRLVAALGGLFGRLHGLGAFHRQFNHQNVLVLEDDAGAPRLIPIDLDHLSLGPPLAERECAWSFHQLAFHLAPARARWGRGRSDLIRFLDGYNEALGGSDRHRRDLARWVSGILPARPLERRPHRREYLRRYENRRFPYASQ